MWQMHDGWGWWMVVGWVWMVLFWGLIIWAVYAVVTRLDGNRDRQQPDEPGALTLLERRYVRGEISQEEFERMRETVTRGPRTPVA
jgi:putative membrane protein